jgi:hypothetical protein
MAVGNILTNNAIKIMLDRTYNDDGSTTYTAPTLFKVGISNDTPLITDTDLDTPIPITGTEAVDACDATTGWSGGTDSAVSLNTSTFKEGTGSLNIYKSGTSSTVFSASKTTTSVDYTSKDLHVWVYITTLADLVATGTACTVHFGTDNSNYYVFNIAITSLAAGWNLIKKASGDADSTTGTPTIATCAYTNILFNTDLAADLVSDGDVFVDDIKVASSDDYTKTYESGYPTINESTFEVTTKTKLGVTHANGYNINGFCTINTDTTPLMFNEVTFTAESKSNTDEFIFTVVDRVI